MKTWIHNILMKILLSKGGLSEEEINRTTKRINLGLYSMATMFFEPYHKTALFLLERCYGYTCWETQIRFNATWCDSGDKVNEDFEMFNKRLNEERNKVIARNKKQIQ